MIALACACLFAEAQAPSEPASARSVVILFSRSLAGTSCSNGFAIGDGSLIIAPYRVIYPAQSAGQHEGDAFVTALSPYLGDAVDAEVVARDRAADVAVLRTRWKGHPALKLAEEIDVVSTEAITIMSQASIVSAVRGANPAGVTLAIRADVQPLEVDHAAVRKAASITLHARSSASLTTACIGGPMLLSGAGEAAACVSRFDNGHAVGVSATQIRRVLEMDNELATAAVNATENVMPRPNDSTQATVLLSKALAASAAQQPQQSLDYLRAFIKLRPKCAVAYRDAAGQARAIGQLDECQELYGQAVTIDPSLSSARILYGQLLQERKLTGHALTHLRYVWQHGPTPTAAVIPLVNILRESNNETECLEILEEAVKKRPNDSYLWSYLGQSRRTLNKPADAATAFLCAYELRPEDLSRRVEAASAFEAAGELKQAETHYRGVVDTAPNSSAAHYFLALFLANHSKSRDEALACARKALELADQPGAPPREKIAALINELTSAPAGK